MVWTDEEFKKESEVFLENQWKWFNENYPFDITSLALEYVKNSNIFENKDDVIAGVLVDCLENAGYIQFTERKNNIRYYSLTEKGLEYIKNKQRVS